MDEYIAAFDAGETTGVAIMHKATLCCVSRALTYGQVERVCSRLSSVKVDIVIERMSDTPRSRDIWSIVGEHITGVFSDAQLVAPSTWKTWYAKRSAEVMTKTGGSRWRLTQHEKDAIGLVTWAADERGLISAAQPVTTAEMIRVHDLLGAFIQDIAPR